MAATIKDWVNGQPPQVDAVDVNGFKFENNNLIASTGEILDPNDHDQTSQAVSAYAAGGAFYGDSGVANAYALDTVGFKFAPKDYFLGMTISFLPQVTSTGASTVNVTSLGVRSLLLPNGDPVVPNAVRAGEYISAFFDGIAFKIIGRFEIITGGFPGEMKIGFINPIPAGWIEYVSGTIGDAASGATILASPDAAFLYANIWDLVLDQFAPVTGGRGVSAEADFTANKPMALPEGNGRALAMAGAGTGLTPRSIGEFFGDETVQLTIAEMPSHTHPPAPGKTNFVHADGSLAGRKGEFDRDEASETGSAGGDQPHNNMQPSLFTRVILKL